MKKQVNWNNVLKAWKPSTGTRKVTEEDEVNAIIYFCKYVSENFWDKIGFFDVRSKEEIEQSDSSKSEIFSMAAKQITIHRKVWQVIQKKYPSRLSYEFPLAVRVDSRLRYMKFQIKENKTGLHSPNKVKKVWLDFHTSDQKIEVIYE